PGNSESFLARLPLTHQRNFTILDANRAELTVAAGEPLPTAVRDAIAAQHVRVVHERPSEAELTYTIGPMAIRSEGGKRTQYVLLNARGRGEVEVVRDAETRLRAALADGRLEMPAGATYRWVGRYEQKLNADASLRGIIAASMAVMIVLIYVGTRSWLITAIIILCNATVTTAGGFFFVWLWGVEMTTAVVVGFLVLLGVMFNDGILLGTYIQEQFKTRPKDADEVNRRVFLAGLRRRRPAIMTNATTLLSLIPVLWAAGRGSELMQPMVLPVIGGMVFDVISLFSVPVFFTWYWERKLVREAEVTAAMSEPAPSPWRKPEARHTCSGAVCGVPGRCNLIGYTAWLGPPPGFIHKPFISAHQRALAGASESPMRRDGAQTNRQKNNERIMTTNERKKVSTETLREPTRPAKPDRQPEASLGWRPETAPSSAGSELQGRVVEPRNSWLHGF
ncbi:MAG: efflux RND transporter permease subunit, partial [Opitutaceae bacterium]